MRLRVLVGCWLAAWIGAALLVATISPRWRRFYEDMGFALRAVTERLLELGDWLASPGGALVVALALTLGLTPLRLTSEPSTLTRWFGGGALLALLLGVFAWLALELPLSSIHFYPVRGPDAFQLAVEARPGPVLAMLVFGLLFAVPPAIWLLLVVLGAVWLRTGIGIYRLPRGPLRHEALRAALLCWFPALVIATPAAEAVRLGYTPASLIVPPPFAAFGTVVVVLYGAALWYRLRRPAAEDVSAPAPPT